MWQQSLVGHMPHSFSDVTRLERSVFFLFMVLWIVYGVLNQYSALHGVTFDATTVVWVQEVLKVTLSLILFFLQDGGVMHLCQQIKQHWTMFFWYLIPAGMYALADVLMIVNLRCFDPATLYLLLELKVVMVAILYQILFKRVLRFLHWLALLVVTGGSVLKAIDAAAEDQENGDNSNANTIPHPTLFNYMLIALHILLTTFAGVFNEKLLKEKALICINLQNMFLYFDGILFLTFGILAGVSEHKAITDALSPTSLEALFAQPSIVAMAVIMSLAGIVTSRFLKIFDSVQKSVAVALVVVTLPILSHIFFATPITAKTICSVLMVVFGMHLYNSQPQPQTRETEMEVELTVEDESDLFLNEIDLGDVNIEHYLVV